MEFKKVIVFAGKDYEEMEKLVWGLQGFTGYSFILKSLKNFHIISTDADAYFEVLGIGAHINAELENKSVTWVYKNKIQKSIADVNNLFFAPNKDFMEGICEIADEGIYR